MRILIATGIYPPEIGGPATAMSDLAAELRLSGHEVTVLTYGEPREEKHVLAVPRSGNVLQRYHRYFAFARKLLGSSDVILATDVFSVGIPVRCALIGKQTRFVVRLGGERAWEDAVEKGRSTKSLRVFWKEQAAEWRMRLAICNYRWILKRASVVAVTSDLLKGLLSEAMPDLASKFETVWNISDVAASTGMSDARPHSPLRLVYIGRFAKVKNVPLLANALKAASLQGAAVECVFVGSGETLAACKNILKDVPGIYFMGAVAHGSLPAILAESDLLALPSLSDICPNVVIEALASGVPCIMTSEHGLSKPVAGTIELDPSDVAVWTDTIVHFASSKNAYVELRDAVKPIVFPEGKSLIDIMKG